MGNKILILTLFCLSCFAVSLGLLSQTPMNSETFVFDQRRQFSIKLNIPQNWKATRERGTPVPFTNQTYDLIIEPLSNEKALLRITFGRTPTGEQITAGQFDSLVESRISSLLPFAVEDIAAYKHVTLSSGYGRYCILTDASLVNRSIPQDEYLYLTMYFAYYENGYIVYATFLADEIDNETFYLMLDVLSSIEASN